MESNFDTKNCLSILLKLYAHRFRLKSIACLNRYAPFTLDRFAFVLFGTILNRILSITKLFIN